MAYTIKPLGRTKVSIDLAIQKAVKKDGRFSVRDYEWRGDSVVLKFVRLTVAKPYCGQHCGPCLVNPIFGAKKKLVGRWLEWDDWVSFHNLINDVLDRISKKYGVGFEVWTDPMEVKGRMWVRKGNVRRFKYEYDGGVDRFGRQIQNWNLGTEDQFVP